MFSLMNAAGPYKTPQKSFFISNSFTFILAGRISSNMSLVKPPTFLLDQNWLPATWCKAQVEKFKPISFPSIRDSLQQLLSPKEQEKSALQFFPLTITT